MARVVIPNAIKREKGKLYYINSKGDIGEANLRGGGSEPKLKTPEIGKKNYWSNKKKNIWKNCENCQISFFCKWKGKKYCTKQCSQKANRKDKSKGYNRGIYKSSCIYCGSKFPKRSPGHKICSDYCREKIIESRKKLSSEEYALDNKAYKSRFEILKRDGFKCHYCGRSASEDGVKLHIDHITPKSRGGKDDPENYITSCSECNIGKRDIFLEERHT